MLTKEQLEKLSAKRLLTYKKKWNRGTPAEFDDQDCKDSWAEYMNLIKSVLATKEHVE